MTIILGLQGTSQAFDRLAELFGEFASHMESN